MSYKSPITTSISHIYDDVLRNFDDVLMVRVREAIEFEIDKDELIKALAYDRGQYKAGFDAGYMAALEYIVSTANERIRQGRGGTKNGGDNENGGADGV